MALQPWLIYFVTVQMTTIFGLHLVRQTSEATENSKDPASVADSPELSHTRGHGRKRIKKDTGTVYSNADMALVIRAYSGEAPNLQGLLENLQMFVPSNVARVVVLDDESPEDHELGTALLEKWAGISVQYEALPTSFELKVTAPFCKVDPKYCTVGYTRQQWSSFYLDKYTNATIIGQMDSDARLFSFLAPFNVATDNHGKVIVRAIPHDHELYQGDQWFLKSGAKDINSMTANNFPMFFWRETFGTFRAHVAALHGVAQFDDAFSKLQDTGLGFSWQNLIYRFALFYRKQQYSLCDPYSPKSMCFTIGYNGDCEPTRQVAAGCCRTFNELTCDDTLKRDSQHLLQQGYMYRYNQVPMYISRKDLVDVHYERIHEYLQQVPEAKAMQDQCAAFMDNNLQLHRTE